MATTVKNLLRISMTIRNVGLAVNYTATKRFVQSSVQYRNSNKESLVAAQPHLLSEKVPATLDKESLPDVLKDCKKVDEVLDLVQKNTNILSFYTATIALQTLLDISKNNPRNTQKMYNDNRFLLLCDVLKKKMRTGTPNDCLSALKVMLFFDVPSTSIIVQMLLQMLRHSLHNLELRQISFLDFLLKKCDRTPLVDALRAALPIIYENNVLMKLDRSSVQNISNAITFLCKTSTNTQILGVLLKAMQKCKEDIEPMQAKSMLWSLCDLQCKPAELEGTLNYMYNILTPNILQFNKQTFLNLLSLIIRRVQQGDNIYYNEGFVDACVSALISKDYGFDDAISMLNGLNSIQHTQISLLDYIAGKCFKDPAIMQRSLRTDIAVLVNGLSVADYKPIFWDVIEAFMMNDGSPNGKYEPYPLTKLALHLLTLDCYWDDLMSSITAEPANSLYEKRQMLFIYQTVTTLYPDKTFNLPIQYVDDLLNYQWNIKSFPLLEDLGCAMGGPRYVLTNVKSRLNHFIDHVIVLRKGGYPIAINNGVCDENGKFPIITLDDLQVPPESQVILILYVPHHAYARNTQRMNGMWSLKIKSLEALTGYTVIPIRSSMWTSLLSAERIPYVMQAIRLKCDPTSITAQS